LAAEDIDRDHAFSFQFAERDMNNPHFSPGELRDGLTGGWKRFGKAVLSWHNCVVEA
jgi:hypothetical protein